MEATEYDDPFPGFPFFSEQSLSAKIEKSPTLILRKKEIETICMDLDRTGSVNAEDSIIESDEMAKSDNKSDEPSMEYESDSKFKEDEPEDVCYENVSKSNEVATTEALKAQQGEGGDCLSSDCYLDGAIYDAPWDLGALQKGLEEKFKMNEEQRSRDSTVSFNGERSSRSQTERFSPKLDSPRSLDAAESLSRRGSSKRRSDKGKSPSGKSDSSHPEANDPRHGSVLQKRPLPAFPDAPAASTPTSFKSQNFPSGSLAQPPQNPFHRKGVPVMGGGSVGRGHQSKPSLPDWRPLEDYDAPWDNRQKNLMSTFSQEPTTGTTTGTTSTVPTGTGFRGSTKSLLFHSSLAEKIESRLPLEQEWWYHGPITRHDAERRLKSEREGSYLIRNSESNRLDYSLSIKSSTGCIHLKIVPNDEGRFILGQFSQPFPSVAQMIQHYTVNKLPIKGAEHMSLTFPVGH